MKKILLVTLLAFLSLGCSKQCPTKEILARVNNYEITKQEFLEEFKQSDMSRTDSAQARKEFLPVLINRILILQDAQKNNLDKDRNFLKMVQRFWEQSLLKVAIDKKTKQIAGSVVVNDKAIEVAYKNLVKEGKTDKPYESMYNQLKWEITKLKETEALNNWLSGLKNKATITVNQDLLNK